MRKKVKNEINVNEYKEFLDKLVLDKKIKEEIEHQFYSYLDEGELKIEGNSLYGRIITEKGVDYLNILYDKSNSESLICNYTRWNAACTVNIQQSKLNNGYKIAKKETTNYICKGIEELSRNTEIQKIYNVNKQLIYEYKAEIDETFDITSEGIKYERDHFLSKDQNIERTWYIDNKYIIIYSYYDNFTHNRTYNKYSVCQIPDESWPVYVYHYNDLDPELFMKYMEDKITIEELIQQNSEHEKQKRLEKNINIKEKM